MRKILILAIAVFALAIAMGTAAAHFGPEGTNDEVQNIADSGTYEEYQEYVAQGGMGPRWVDSEEDFQQWQQRHQEMRAFHEENGFGAGMMNGRGQRTGGCPMWG